MASCAVLVVAAGRGSRFGGEVPKQYLPLAGVPVVRRTMLAFLAHPAVTAVRPVIHPDDHALFAEAADGLAILPPAEGGAKRQDSVRLGLESLIETAPDLVLIQDAARPFADAALIDRVVARLAEYPAAIPGVPVSDTLKRGGDNGLVAATVPRAGLYRAQTPQGFRFPEILQAHRAAAGQDLTDDAAVAEAAGLAVALVDGSEENVKVTTRDDLARAERTLAEHWEFRSGTGFDVHRVRPGDHVMLGGIRIASPFGLEGHSDADVALHAITDALLGAIGGGDIGQHFPPSDACWKGADSAIFLAAARDAVRARGGRIINVDLTVLCEAPRVGPHRAAMASRIAEILEIPSERVNVKATTTERLGFTGRGEGIAAQAAATVRLVSA